MKSEFCLCCRLWSNLLLFFQITEHWSHPGRIIGMVFCWRLTSAKMLNILMFMMNIQDAGAHWCRWFLWR